MKKMIYGGVKKAEAEGPRWNGIESMTLDLHWEVEGWKLFFLFSFFNLDSLRTRATRKTLSGSFDMSIPSDCHRGVGVRACI